MKHIKRKFDSLAHMVSHIADTPIIEGANDRATARQADEWTGFLSFDDVKDICIKNHGYWAEGAKAIYDIAVKLDNPATPANIKSKRPTRSYAGSRPHVAAAVAGSQRAMLTPTKKERFKPVIKICVPLNGNCKVEQTSFYNRGAAILSAVNKLEAQGHKVELTGVLFAQGRATTDRDINWSCEFVIKPAHKRLSAHDLGYTLTHCTVTRRITMGLMERDQDIWPCTNDAYGHPAMPAYIKKELNYDLVLPVIHKRDYDTPTKATKEIQNQFKQLNELTKKAA